MARRSPVRSLLALALVGGCAWIYTAPYRAFADLKTAAREGDQQALEELVDFPAFRASIKDNVRSSVQNGIGGQGGGLLGRLGGLVAGAVTAPVVDHLVTPGAIAALTDGVRPGEERGDDGEPRGEERKKVQVRRGYEDASTFVVHLQDPDDSRELLALVMRREGLDWRLAAVRLPGADPAPQAGEDEQ
jgi:hypothetical protein